MRRLLLLALFTSPISAAELSVTKSDFGKAGDTPVELYTIRNGKGMTASVTTYGAILTKLEVPDKNGKLADVVLGFDDLKGYLAGHPYFGATVGRVANRVADAKFTLDGKEYKLDANNGKNSLHGGKVGFDKRVWKAEILKGEHEGVKFTLVSADGDEGYPGTLNVSVSYTLDDENKLSIDYSATTDKATPVNLTHHSYFNLAGQGNGDVLGHSLKIDAGKYTAADEKTLIPTGELKTVEGSAFDFTKAKPIGQDIAKAGGDPAGYDLNYALDGKAGGEPFLAAEVSEPISGRVMKVLTTEPGLQFYTGNFLDGTLTGKGGAKYAKHGAFCLEAQHFPDSPNQPKFPSVILKPGQTYKQTTIYAFSMAGK